ncbi:RagB/SusD family nutrient uptake outer membrane protein [Olivibacter sp. SDN3]|uniref:RagB/SusD family nutrient uptake outer membrane protein n=1 Tax=Olivibacter sp. SDN3 TaxID=2764720 RepID=UPI00165195C2|nr:RagB/SusD family nutrient uptake outer membrane protein [Olivibacter sp. SDN3]QNL52077.1 RagB/SusD family nutrient uptake outer membrane protein [Olivibacter sp. SDN3]
MKNTYFKVVILIVTTMLGCTNLDENAYDQMLTENFYNNRNEVISAVLRPYTHANAWVTPSGQDGWWRPAELSGDQLAWPTKGRHGEDGGKWKRLHYHTWTVDEGGLNNAWSLMYWGMGLCNDPIENLEARDVDKMGITEEEKAAFIAELKLLRAFHYLKLMDLFGNIPIVTQVGEPAQPETVPRAEVFNFIESEILENIESVPVLSRPMLGRMSKAGAYAMLVELYLNAEVWTGTARWDDCIAAADQLINGAGGGQNGAMALDPDIVSQFNSTNDQSKEVIFSIAYDYTTANFEPRFPLEFYHFIQREIYGGGRNGNNGIVLVPGVYGSFSADDLRKTEWLLEGDMVNFETGEPVIGTEEYRERPLVFVDNIRRNRANSTVSNMSEGEENSGIRFNKYKLGNQVRGFDGTPEDPNYNNTDWNIYRLTWVYFAKAEAIMRKNGGTATQEVVELINECRKRAFSEEDWTTNAYTVATLTMDEFLAERGREFIFEGFRRNDLIRFGKFTTEEWWDHTPSDPSKELFPIPQRQRDLNPNLAQNPGYN